MSRHSEIEHIVQCYDELPQQQRLNYHPLSLGGPSIFSAYVRLRNPPQPTNLLDRRLDRDYLQDVLTDGKILRAKMEAIKQLEFNVRMHCNASIL